MTFSMGAAAIDRAESLDTSTGWLSYAHTAVVTHEGPCNIGENHIGHLTSFSIYLTAATTGLRFAVLTPINGSVLLYKVRGYTAAVSGTVGPGLVTLSDQDLRCLDDDRIAAYATNLHIDMGDGGEGYGHIKYGANPFGPKNDISATLVTGKTLSLSASGYIETPAPTRGQYTAYERNEGTDDSSDDFSNTNHVCQTFTVGTTHKLHQIDLKLIRTGSCGKVTAKVYATDSSNKPTGSALASVDVDQSILPTSSADWIQFRLSSPITLEAKMYAIVLSAEAAGAWVRYQATGEYLAGSMFESTDSGATWTQYSDVDIVFREFGLPVSISGSYIMQLYPKGEGTHTQLVPAQGFIPDSFFGGLAENWQFVSDIADSPDEYRHTVMYALGHIQGPPASEFWSVFLSGEDEGRAGHLKSFNDESYNLWTSGVNGLTSPGQSLFDQYLQPGDILRSPTQNQWYGQYRNRMARVLSVEDSQNLTLAEDPKITFNGAYGAPDPRKAWFVTPCSKDTADNPPDDSAPVGPENLPFNYLEGQWSWNKDSKHVTGSGGNASEVLLYPATIHRAFTEGLSHRPHTSSTRNVDYVEDDNSVYIDYDYSWASRTDPGGKTNYISYTFQDAYGNETTETQWCKPTKRDSYMLKSTLNKNRILEVRVVSRVCVALLKNDTWESITGTSQPLLKLNGIDAIGTETTLPSVHPMGFWKDTNGNNNMHYPVFFTLRDTISRPGGGAWTVDDINNLEVGIILGNLGGAVQPYAMGKDPINAPACVACTQLYVEVVMTNERQNNQSGFYMTQYGQRVFPNGFDEWAMPIYDFGMNMSAHWIYGSTISDFVAKPIALLRKVTSKILGRHRVSRQLSRGKTNKTV